jgi:FkbM family methyltransferase
MISNRVKRVLSSLGARDALLRVGAKWYRADQPSIVQTTVRGAKMLVLANEDVGRRILFLRQYEPRDADLLAKLTRPKDICFDVGGNTGYYTMLMARAASEGEVHAFEPVPLNWHMLCSGALLNGYTHVEVNKCAVGGEDGEMSFSEASDGAYSSLVPVGRKSERAQLKVAVRSVDSYVREHSLPRVDVMKVDVEGAEPMVLDGAAQLLSDPARRPRAIMMELHDTNLAAYGTTVVDMIARLKGFGYAVYVAPSDGPVRHFAEGDRNIYVNVFFVSAEKAPPELG